MIAALALCVSSFTWGEPMSLKEVTAANGTPLTVDELKQLLPGARVTSRNPSGSTHYWQNNPDGKFVASTDARGKGGRGAQVPGSWRIGDDGTYCLKIDWPREPDNSCRYLFKVGNKYFGIGSQQDVNALIHEFEFVQ
jgi:hypothetical protein